MQASYITPAVTIFDGQGHIDIEANKKIYDHLITNGIKGILILGSIGEFYGIPLEEKKLLIREAISYIDSRTLVYVGTGGTVFEECVLLSNYAMDYGADGVAVLSPYYFYLSDKESYDYYATLAKRVCGNILLYNFPARTGYQLSADTVLKLAIKYPNITGIKDTVGEMGHTRKLIRKVKKERSDFLIYSGFDEFFFHNILSGGDGCIGGLSNIFPEIATAMVDVVERGHMEEVSRYQRKLDGIMDIYGIQEQFVPVIKTGVQLRGVPINPACLFPMKAVTKNEKAKIKKIIEDAV